MRPCIQIWSQFVFARILARECGLEASLLFRKEMILLKKSVPGSIFLERRGVAMLSERFRRNADDDGPAAAYRAVVL